MQNKATTAKQNWTEQRPNPDDITPAMFNHALSEWKAKVQGQIDAHFAKHLPMLEGDVVNVGSGTKYIKIIKQTRSGLHRSVFCFIEKATGDVLMAASWKAPAKHARGNIFTDELGVGVYGAHYLR